MSELVARARLTVPAKPAFGGLLIVERNAMVYRRTWMILFSGFFEPLFYLFFFVYPLERFIGDVTSAGETIEYAAFVAPALLASSAMNGAFYDATNVFWKLRYGKVYDSILATPIGPKDVAVGETIWAVVRAMLYSAAFLLVIVALGLVESWWALLALPACFVIGFGFAGAGIAAVTWMRNWKDFDLIQLIMLPMFMFSATFYPISVYPEVLEWIVRCLPLYHGIELVRSLTTGSCRRHAARQRRLPGDHGSRRDGDRVAPHRHAAAEVAALSRRRVAPGGSPDSRPMRNEKSRSGQNVTNTFPKIGSPRTVPNVRLSIATLRLSPRRKYCSFGTRTDRNGSVVMSSNLTSFTNTVPSRPSTTSPGPPATRRMSSRSRASSSGTTSPATVSAAWTTTMSPGSGSRILYVIPSASTRPSQAAIAGAMAKPLERAETSSSAKSSTRIAIATMTMIARARVMPRSMAAATLPETAVAAPACFFLHAGRGLRSRLDGGDA